MLYFINFSRYLTLEFFGLKTKAQRCLRFFPQIVELRILASDGFIQDSNLLFTLSSDKDQRKVRFRFRSSVKEPLNVFSWDSSNIT